MFRSFISSWRDHHYPQPHDLVVHHDYSPFRFSDPHHHHYYDPTSSYYTDAAMDSYASSSAAAAAASVYSPYMVHHHSPPPTNSNSPSIKPETSVTAAAALQSALSLSTPMNVNVSMNFNSHNIQYATGYNVPTPSAATTNLSYEPFYGSNRHSVPSSAYHQHHHHNSMPLEIKNRSDPVTTKQAMLLSAAATYDYKDLSKLCEFFPTPSSSTGSNEKRKYVLRFSNQEFISLFSSWLQTPSTSKSSNNKMNEGRINRCRICGKIYARPSTLKTHLRTHSGEKVIKIFNEFKYRIFIPNF